jgi:hypothetical protein
MAKIQNRIALLEMRLANVDPCSLSEPFWSEQHGCMMENLGGLILPCVIADADEWERAAIEHHAKLVKVSMLG